LKITGNLDYQSITETQIRRRRKKNSLGRQKEGCHPEGREEEEEEEEEQSR
jgi:hypothetical protein